MKTSPKKRLTKAIEIDDQFCKGCFLCQEVCPKKLFARGGRRTPGGYSMPEVRNLDECISCRTCEMTCPDLALTVWREGE
jgi:2-oxoglutarate ferredoxin oxidoreductase subunit delta